MSDTPETTEPEYDLGQLSPAPEARHRRLGILERLAMEPRLETTADTPLVDSFVGTPETTARHERTKAATARSFLAAAASLGAMAAFAPPLRHRNSVREYSCALCSELILAGDGRRQTGAGVAHSRCLPPVTVKAKKPARISDEFLP